MLIKFVVTKRACRQAATCPACGVAWGIPPEDLENVKTKFFKGKNSVRGSGIGLALVDSIMTALDGTMDIKSTLGRGTVVTLGLPLYRR